MPNIIPYESKSELTPSDKGINAAADAARLYGRIGEQIGHDVGGGLNKISDAIERHMAIMESSELYKTAPQIELGLKQTFDEASARPENRANPHFGSTFLASDGPVDKILESWHVSVNTPQGKDLAMRLKADMRNSIARHVYAGQAAMDAQHQITNLEEGLNGLKADVAYDPSVANYNLVMGKADNMIQSGTAAIPDVGKREETATYYNKRAREEITAARYRGAFDAVTKQISLNGDEAKSPAYTQTQHDIKDKLGHEYMDLSELPKQLEQAVSRGKELFGTIQATAKSETIEAGKADFSKIHNTITELVRSGRPPTPEVADAIHRYADIYGRTNPGEVASLDDYLLRADKTAQGNEVQPYDQRTRDNIQAGFSLPSGDPRRPTLASLTKDYSHGRITKEDFATDTEILNKIDKPETDPTFRPAWESFTRWQSQMLQSIGAQNAYGAGPARAQFLHDSTAAFMAQGHGGAGWDKALDNVTNAQKPHSFGHVVKFYDDAANKGAAAAQWLQQHDQFQAGATTAPAYGSQAAPVYPTNHNPAPAPAPAHAPVSAAEQKKADEIIWGKK